MPISQAVIDSIGYGYDGNEDGDFEDSEYDEYFYYNGPDPCAVFLYRLEECRGSVMNVAACRHCSSSELHTHMFLNASVLLLQCDSIP